MVPGPVNKVMRVHHNVFRSLPFHQVTLGSRIHHIFKKSYFIKTPRRENFQSSFRKWQELRDKYVQSKVLSRYKARISAQSIVHW